MIDDKMITKGTTHSGIRGREGGSVGGREGGRAEGHAVRGPLCIPGKGTCARMRGRWLGLFPSRTERTDTSSL